MASFMALWRSSSFGLVIDYACDFGWWRQVGGAEREGVKVSPIMLAHWVNEYSHADRNDAKSFPIAENLSAGNRQWVGNPAIYLTSLGLPLSLPPSLSFYLTFVLACKPKTFGPPINLLQLLFLSCSECVVCLLFPLFLFVFIFIHFIFAFPFNVTLW